MNSIFEYSMSSKKMTCVLLTVGFLFIFSHSVNGLSCYCDICADSNYTCVTDGYCFKSISKDTSVVRHSSRCLENNIVYPFRKPLICHYIKKYNDSFVTECCNDYDFCNRDLKLTLHIKLTDDSLNNPMVKETEKQSHAISPEEKKTVAYHEAGHALISWLLPTTDSLPKVTLVPRTNAVLGFAQYMPTDGYILSKKAIAEEFLKKESLNYEEMVKLIGLPPNGEKRTVEMYELNSPVDTKNTDSSKN